MSTELKNHDCRIGDLARAAFVVAYKEDVGCLVKALQVEGFDTQVLREPHEKDDRPYSQTLDVLRTHMNAWMRCAAGESMAVVVEADFVPTVGMAEEEPPFHESKADQAFGYLYACGPELYDLDEFGKARGHAGGAVGYLISPVVARVLVEFGTHVLKNTPTHEYTPWDTSLGYFLKSRGIESYIPYRMLGEHGGKPNEEHKRAGLTPTNRADTLANRLHFLPFYAEGSLLRYWLARLYAKYYGLGRLICLRYLRSHDFCRARHKMQLLRYVVGRYLSFW